jgi:FKBP-type peptidyl-prolyl cis-trans isomerase SlyD
MEVLRGAPSALRFSKAFAMNITKDTAVTINYKITDKLGKLLDNRREPAMHDSPEELKMP